MKYKTLIQTLSETTLEYHDTLNPDLWDEYTLKPEVASKLIMIAHTWAAFSKIPPQAIKDIILVGGNANYNYTPFSDIDLHLVVDTSALGECEEVIQEYLRNKKQLWSFLHDIKIYGHDVELYAQDIKTPFVSGQGVYSIQNNQWLAKPEHKQVNLDDPDVQKKVVDYVRRIDTLISSNADEKSFESMKEKLRNMRSSGLQAGGEFAPENLAFKELRNLGHIDRLNDYLRTSQDKLLSLEQ